MHVEQVEDCQIWDKIRKIGPNLVQMARFGLIFEQDRSHRVWDASGMPPRPQNTSKNPRKRGFWGIGVRGENSPIFPYSCGLALKGKLH